MTTSAPSPSPLIDKISAFVRGGFLALLPVAAASGGLAIAPLLGLAGATALRPSLATQVRAAPAYLWLLLAFTAWAALSSLWSPYPDHSQAIRVLATMGLGLAFVAATPAHKRLTEWGGLFAVIVLIGFLAIEGFGGMPLNRLAQPDALDWVLMRNPGRGASVLAIIIWSALAALIVRGGSKRWALGAALFVLGAAVSAQFEMWANTLAFGAGAALFALGLLAPRAAIALAAGGSALWLLAAPFVVPSLARATQALDLPHSWRAREAIWTYASGRIGERFWFGFGMDGPRTFTDTFAVGSETMRAVPLHPHSVSLQIWLETGLVGALLAAAALIAGGLALARGAANNRPAAAAASATLGAGALIANVSYGAWQEWWIAALFSAAALALAIPRSAEQD